MKNGLVLRVRELRSQLSLPEERHALAAQILAATLVAFIVLLLGWRTIPIAIGLFVLLFLLVARSSLVITFFITYMLFSHQYYSAATISLGGIDWHPREFLLFLLLAHAALKITLGRTEIHWGMLHRGMGAMAVFFTLVLVIGVFRGNQMSAIIAESRFPIFILAYFATIALVQTRKQVFDSFHIVLLATVAVACMSIAYFVYANLSGKLVQLNQTPLGEFMIYPFRGALIQMVRPNGHVLFEVMLVTLVSVLISTRTRWRRFFLLCLGAVFAFAITITFMRTAYISVIVSFFFLSLTFIPRKNLMPLLGSFLVLALLGTIALVAVQGLAPFSFSGNEVEASLRARFIEIAGALDVFVRYPILGIGMGGGFEALNMAQSGDQLAAAMREYTTVHNVWVYYLYKGGMVGIGIITFAYFSIVGTGYAALKELDNPYERAVLRGLVASFLAQLVAGLAMPRLIYPQGYVLVGLATIFFCACSTRFTKPRSLHEQDIFH
jgi:O-antigen ligase